MNEFTASNGHKFVLTQGGALRTGHEPFSLPIASAEMTQALREFFRAEADECLGRWRWPENPEFVVYPFDEYGQTVVVNEVSGHNITFLRDQVNPNGSQWAACARAFFDAHPEPDPDWFAAEEGDVWIITHNGNEYPAIFQADRFRDHGGSWGPGDITDARRIWPEVSS